MKKRIDTFTPFFIAFTADSPLQQTTYYIASEFPANLGSDRHNHQDPEHAGQRNFQHSS